MINRVKDWFGIEGVKLELDIPDTIPGDIEALHGIIVFSSLREQTVEKISFTFSEKYQRGRGKDKRIDDNILASEERKVNILIKEKQKYHYPFRLPFEIIESSMDKYAKRPILRPLINTLKWTNAVKSEYFLEVSAQVKGTHLNPHSRKNIKLVT